MKCWNWKELRILWTFEGNMFQRYFHACPFCGDEMDPRQARDQDRPKIGHSFAGSAKSFTPELSNLVETRLETAQESLLTPIRGLETRFHQTSFDGLDKYERIDS